MQAVEALRCEKARNRVGAPLDQRPGLLFPAATAVQGKRMLVANLALPLTPREGDEWEEKVTRWNLMQFDIPDIDPR